MVSASPFLSMTCRFSEQGLVERLASKSEEACVSKGADLDHHGVVQEPIEKGGGDDRIAEHLAPLGEAAVRGEDHRAFLVAGVYALEEQVGAAWRDREIPDLVDHEQGRSALIANSVAQLLIPLGLGPARR